MNHLEDVRGFVVENFLFGDAGDLTDDTSFMESGTIDSTGVLSLVAFLEETYGITVADDELVPDNLDSLANVARYLEGKVAAVATAD